MMLQCSKFHDLRFPMFSVIALYFAHRRNTIAAERYIASLSSSAVSAPLCAKPAVQDVMLARAA
ncbi:hypothetical protein [Sphingobium aromaticiconvertens]|uniref:hypothetical protein n=1 Tax=Sphingobium aromaticiconvertens TaxID=365341 RepID=UPI003018FD32